MAPQFIDPKFICRHINVRLLTCLSIYLSLYLSISIYLHLYLYIYISMLFYVCIQNKHNNINESIYLHPERLTAGSPTAITHLERKMILAKPPGNDVQNVNLQGCI